MRKAKIMLLAILILATVGTVLAFKVKKIGTMTYCYTITEVQPPPEECTEWVHHAQAKPRTNGTKIYYTTSINWDNCGKLECPNVAELPFLN